MKPHVSMHGGFEFVATFCRGGRGGYEPPPLQLGFNVTCAAVYTPSAPILFVVNSLYAIIKITDFEIKNVHICSLIKSVFGLTFSGFSPS